MKTKTHDDIYKATEGRKGYRRYGCSSARVRVLKYSGYDQTQILKGLGRSRSPISGRKSKGG